MIAAAVGGGIERQPLGIDVGEHRPRAGHHHRQRGVGGGKRRRDHLVAGADVERAENQRDRVGAGADADRVRALARRSELAPRSLDLRAEHEPAAGDDAVDRGVDAARSSPGVSALNGITRRGSDIAGQCGAIDPRWYGEDRRQRHRGVHRSRLEERRIGVKAADVDDFFSGGHSTKR